MKVCNTCGQAKPPSDYYRHQAMADGRLGACKECVKARVHAYREANLERVRAYDRKRGLTERRQAKCRAYAKTARGKRISAAAKKRWSEQNTIKRAANLLVNNAVRDKRLTKGPCEVCGTTQRVHGHHDDYSKPLEVRWLCPKHHAEHHRKLRGH